MQRSQSALPWLVWGVAVFAYAIAVVNRSSLAALGPATQEHFGIDATTLSLFPLLQLIVYAGLQIPVGVLLDRAGASLMILTGSLLMVAGQVTMATVPDATLAILARVLVGAGDACIFISVMRMLPEWFPVRQLPTLSQVTGLIGQAGQLVSVVPLAFAVSVFGWASGFLGIAAAGLLVTVLVCLVLRDRPGEGTPLERLTGRLGKTSVGAGDLTVNGATGAVAVAPPPTEMIALPNDRRSPHDLGFWKRTRQLLTLPGVRLAYWVHFTTPFALHTFVILWGTPFLTGGLGLSPAAASGLLSLTVVSSMFAGLVLGPVSSRFLERRVWIAVWITVMIAATWTAIILWPGMPPMWLVVAMLVVTPLGGPTSMVAFEVSRSHTPRSFAGFGTGLVNSGGFTSALLVVLLIGLVLDLQGAGSPESYSLTPFKVAFAVQIPFWVFGLTMILIEQHRTKTWMRRHGRRLR